MKRNDLVKILERNGWRLKRNGANHDIYTDGKHSEPIERHNEIPEILAQKIIKRRGLK
ncbi:MAG: type II toxin-antitoxin system HicA family toxin [Oscillospiraceae bacterium]|nr:type II toxin-antitoxin system HicA family toxin [Oscillospiraceae bacterium]